VDATIARRTPFLVSVLAVLALLGGCGSSAPKPDPVREARLVAEANMLCRSWAHLPRRMQDREVVQFQKRVAAVTNALLQAAAYLPAGRSWKEARAKQRALYAERSKLMRSGGFVPGSPNLIERFYRLRLQIYDDVKALGVTSCVGQPPRPPIGG
jgi:hypothetical protein